METTIKKFITSACHWSTILRYVRLGQLASIQLTSNQLGSEEEFDIDDLFGMPGLESLGLGSWEVGETETSGSVENPDFTVTFQHDVVTGPTTGDLQGPSGLDPAELPAEWDDFFSGLDLQPQHLSMHVVCPDDLEPGWWLSTDNDTPF